MALPNGDLITTPFDPQMAYPSDRRMQVDTLNARDSISMFIRWEGMPVYVLENSKIYILQGGRSNEFWKELGTGTGTGGTTFVGQFPTADLLPTSGRSAGDYSFVGTGEGFVQYNWDNIANEWVMAEGQTDMASEFFHIGYKTPLRRPVIFPLFPKDVLVETSGDFVFAPETSVARFIFTGEVEAIRGIETAAADREIKLVNRTGSDIPLRDKSSGIPSGSGMDFGGTDYTWVNGSEITLKGNGTYWELAPNNQIAFSDHLDSVNAQVSVGSDGLEVITGIYDRYIGQNISFKEYELTPDFVDGIVFIQGLGKYWKRATVGPIPIEYFGTSTAEIQSAIDSAIANKFGLQFDPLKVYEFGQITISGGVEIWVNGSTLKFNGTTASPFIDITGNNVKMYDVVAEAPITQSRQFDIRGDNFYSNSIKVTGGSYAINLRGNNPVIDRVEGVGNYYTPLRVFSDTKDIESVTIGKLICTNFRMKGFVHNGAFAVKNINIDNFYGVTNSVADASNGFLIDPDLPVTEFNVSTLNIKNFYCRGTQSGALKCQNVRNVNIDNFIDDYTTERTYSSGYSIYTIGVPNVNIINTRTFDRIRMNNAVNVVVNKLHFTAPSKDTQYLMTFDGTSVGSAIIDSLICDAGVSNTYVFRTDRSNSNFQIYVGDVDLPTSITLTGVFNNGAYPNFLNVNKILRGSTLSTSSDFNTMIGRTERIFVGNSTTNNVGWKVGDKIVLPTPTNHVGWVCISNPTGGPTVWEKYGYVGANMNLFNADQIEATERVPTTGYDLNTLTRGFLKFNTSSITDFQNAPHPGFWVVEDIAVNYVGGTQRHVQTAWLVIGEHETWTRKYITSEGWSDWIRIDTSAPNASTTQRGIIEQSTDAETITGTDTERAVSPANLQAKLNSLILSATATLDFPVIAAGETERLTTTVTGAALLDPVLVAGPDNIYNSNDSTIDAWVSAANTVTVRVRNNGSSSIDPGSGDFKIKVFK